MKNNNIQLKSVILLILISLVSTISFAMLNPAAVYCNKMGYEYTTIETELGQKGICKVNEGTELDAWKFLQGEEGQEYSYCEKNGYTLKISNDSKQCSSIISESCAVCVKDGEEIEVTKLMNLSFREGVCGDKKCVLGENFKNCPSDCESGSRDRYCDAVKDGKCDSDCRNNEDIDCITSLPTEKEFNWLYLIIPLILIVFGIIAYLIYKKLNKK